MKAGRGEFCAEEEFGAAKVGRQIALRREKEMRLTFVAIMLIARKSGRRLLPKERYIYENQLNVTRFMQSVPGLTVSIIAMVYCNDVVTDDNDLQRVACPACMRSWSSIVSLTMTPKSGYHAPTNQGIPNAPTSGCLGEYIAGMRQHSSRTTASIVVGEIVRILKATFDRSRPSEHLHTIWFVCQKLGIVFSTRKCR